MSLEPEVKRTVAFIDGQNLFYAARNAFGYKFPNYDVAALAAAVCRQQGWQLEPRKSSQEPECFQSTIYIQIECLLTFTHKVRCY